MIDVPSQAYWISELTKYNFEGANGHLVASVPGIHSRRSPNAYQLPSGSSGVQFLGSVEASIVGLSHLFHTAADRNGTQLKQLAAFLGKCCENVYGMSEIVLRRNLNVPADVNAVSILVPNPDQFSERDCIQLGFLPRNVAKWVSPLWDSGFFRFSGYVYPKEALAAALGGSNRKVHLILHVAQGPCFPNMMSLMQTEHVLAFCSLVASIQRCTGIWRLEEVSTNGLILNNLISFMARPLLDLSMHNFWLRFQQLLEKDHQNSLILKNLIQSGAAGVLVKS